MKRPSKYRWLPVLSLLYCLPGFTATIYKSIDESGVVRFSDTLPTAGILVETFDIDERATPSVEQEQQRLQDMRETTDRMIADRMAREKHRAELRQLAAQTQAQKAAQTLPEADNSTTIYPGYYGFPVRRPWWPSHRPRPKYPIVHPPLLPPVEERPPNIRPLPGNDYPASLIRRYYDPKVQEAFR
jgi:hypothetical protein